MKVLLVALGAFFLAATAFGQVDVSGSGRALQFDGVDDYVNLGNIYDDLTFPFTVSAWVKTSSDGFSMPIMVTQDNAPLYNGFWFVVDRVTFFLEYGDGMGENLPQFRKGKSAPYVAGEWSHLCAVVKGIDNISMYYNGQDVGGVKSGSSSLPMASNYPGDECKIGLYHSNGQTFWFKGLMDELRLFNRELSPAEIQQQMCLRLKGDEPGLIGYWNFDETSGTTLIDQSTKHYDGTIFGNPQRVYSSAPVGNRSLSLYSATWSNTHLTMIDGPESVTVSDIKGNPYGVHIYQVTEVPSQTGGLTAATIRKPYYGIFIAANDNNNSGDIQFLNTSGLCSSFVRRDNSVDTWTSSNMPIQDMNARIEIVPTTTMDLTVDLGPDKHLCDMPEYKITSGVDPSGKTFRWSTGETTPDITIVASGKYTVEVKSGCATKTDEILVSIDQTPQPFSLGDDEVSCTLKATTLTSPHNASATITWHDGSHGKTFETTDFGSYWVTIENQCGVASDTIHFTKLDIKTQPPNVITPNGDGKNDVFKLETEVVGKVNLEIFNRWGSSVYSATNYGNTWNGGDLSPGIYYYLITSECFQQIRGPVSILRN